MGVRGGGGGGTKGRRKMAGGLCWGWAGGGEMGRWCGGMNPNKRDGDGATSFAFCEL